MTVADAQQADTAALNALSDAVVDTFLGAEPPPVAVTPYEVTARPPLH